MRMYAKIWTCKVCREFTVSKNSLRHDMGEMLEFAEIAFFIIVATILVVWSCG